ncbi:PREDICTED: zinc finger protein 282-like, partial [Eurypyga helias]|uniref:zinc finger protein 282-like n=1 Tax=Eurypyga helias TaxID=54383 RepID=UPI0005295652
VPVAFNDASFSFSEEEWKSLNEWQKELYRHIMKGNYEAVVSMGKDGPGFALSLPVHQVFPRPGGRKRRCAWQERGGWTVCRFGNAFCRPDSSPGDGVGPPLGGGRTSETS